MKKKIKTIKPPQKSNIGTFENLIGNWFEKNKVPLKRGNVDVSANAQGRSVEELILELDEFVDMHVFFVALYQSWRNRPTRRQNEELKALLGRISAANNISRRLFYAIDLQSTNTNEQYALINQRLVIDTFKSQGIRAVEDLYEQNGWEYTTTVNKCLKGLERKRIFKKEFEGGEVKFEKNDILFRPLPETSSFEEKQYNCSRRIKYLEEELKREVEELNKMKK
jgi:hypothetical protein